uniref:dTDP-4-dehydrorhamnose 3,5-epimerase n=1 Tax=Rhodopseudomonas palustris (strain BisA53) TaxID=316055 RepID=Q07IQ3_RHOP5
MRLTPLDLDGAVLIDVDRIVDSRGHFARVFCIDELTAAGLDAGIVQASVSFNNKCGTLRGLHWQAGAQAEAKYVRCTRGAIFDAIVDLRPQSPTYLRWVSIELSQDNQRTLYIPKGFAHGFQTLCDDTEIFYQMTERFAPEAACGARFDDAAFGIVWPKTEQRIISDKDLGYPGFAL